MIHLLLTNILASTSTDLITKSDISVAITTVLDVAVIQAVDFNDHHFNVFLGVVAVENPNIFPSVVRHLILLVANPNININSPLALVAK